MGVKMQSTENGVTLRLNVVDRECVMLRADCECVAVVELNDSGVAKVAEKKDCNRFPLCVFPIARGLMIAQTYFDSVMGKGELFR